MGRIPLVLIACFAIGLVSANDHELVLNDLGCWHNVGSGESASYGEDAVQSCSEFAYKKGYDVFAVHDGSSCLTGQNIRNQYRNNGSSWDCNADGTGGKGISQVYEINRVYQVNYRYVGCYKDTEDRAIPTLEGRFVSLHGNYRKRSDAINKCARAAAALGNRVFAVQDGGWFTSSAGADKTYDKFGAANNCADEDKGVWGSSAIYEITCGKIVDLKDKGCYKDTAERAIPPLEGPGGYLDGKYNLRSNPVEKCVLQASSFKYKAFGIQNGGWCASSETAHKTYNTYGTSDACLPDGEGGPWANQVYRMTIRGISN